MGAELRPSRSEGTTIGRRFAVVFGDKASQRFARTDMLFFLGKNGDLFCNIF